MPKFQRIPKCAYCSKQHKYPERCPVYAANIWTAVDFEAKTLGSFFCHSTEKRALAIAQKRWGIMVAYVEKKAFCPV